MWDRYCIHANDCTTLLHVLPQDSMQTTIESFLLTNMRKIKRVLGDGNCFFRSISHQLFASEEKHHAVRSTLVRFENLNKSVFSSYLMSNNEPTIVTHINKMDRFSTWATQVEVYAASSLFQIPLYTLFYKTSTEFHWEVVKPINKDKLRFPVLVDSVEDFPQPANQLTHFEIAYLEDSHYDSIIDVQTGIPSVAMPDLQPRRPLFDVTNTTIVLEWLCLSLCLLPFDHVTYTY